VLGEVPSHRELQLRLAGLYASTGHVAESARLRNAMADSEPDPNERFGLYVQIGHALLAVGEGADAAVALEKALALRPRRGRRARSARRLHRRRRARSAAAVLGDLLADSKP